MTVLTKIKPDVPVAGDPARAHTLPARYYCDPDIYQREKDAIFYRSWWLAGHESRLAAPGSYLTTRIHEQNVFVIRGRDGALRAFYNVCQHRGHELLEGEGKTAVITCPYHAWCYGLDGKLRTARNTDGLADFDPAAFALPPVRLETFCGFVFVNLDPAAQPLAELTGGLEGEIRRYVPRLDELAFARRDDYDIAANWKVVIDNFLECYHCDPAHRDFVDLVDMPSYRSTCHGHYSSHVSSELRTASSSAYRISGGADFGFAGWYLWPNLTIWAMPGEANIATLQMIPAGPGRTREHLDWYCPGGDPGQELREAMTYIDAVLQPEDIGLCESVQRGLASFGYNQGRLVVDREESELSEHAVHHFQQLVLNALGA
jgi:phenylpropionate dioxygenase-like ring-hydroxylating dioxygenase large terminal subunit